MEQHEARPPLSERECQVKTQQPTNADKKLAADPVSDFYSGDENSGASHQLLQSSASLPSVKRLSRKRGARKLNEKMNDVRGKKKMSHDAVFFQRRRGGKLFDPACSSKISDLDEVSFDGLKDAPGASLINSGAQEQPDQPSYSSVCLGRNDSDKLLLPTTIRKDLAERSSKRSEIEQYGELKVKRTMLRFQNQPI